MGLMLTDGFSNLNETLSKDCFTDSALSWTRLLSHVAKLPDFARQWFINPLLALVTKERIASKKSYS